MTLDRYRAKRSFAETPEPGGEAAGAPVAGGEARFVIQEHHARRLHWDLRLERDGTLVSFALPKGIPQSPKENRLAVHTEDHPLEYLHFEGEIPKGNYGAGTMEIWDRGTYLAEKFRDDKIIVVFDGERVRGRYALFPTKGDNWMIHRMDPPADPGREPMPSGLRPMTATLSTLPPDEERWAYEIKWDGVRALAYCAPGQLRLESRSGREITAQWPELRGIVEAAAGREAVLDGEIVAFDDRGRPDFQRLQPRMHLASDSAVRRRMVQTPATYVIFDLVYLDGGLLTGATYEERRRRLEELGLDGVSWQTPRNHPGDGAALLELTRSRGLEGIVAKRLASRYAPGRRSRDWLKIKNVRTQELVIGGWLAGQGRREGTLGALLVGHYPPGEESPSSLRYAGRVGTGYTEHALADLKRRLEPLARESSPFDGRQPPKQARFVEPRLVAQVEFTEWTRAGTLRAPSFKGLRDDADPRAVRREEPEAPPAAPWHRAPSPDLPFELREGITEVDGRELKLTNLDKVLYPQAGFTKGDVIAYYASIAPALLEHLRGRPLTMKRYPDGVEGHFFYEKECPSHRPDWVRTATIPTGSKRKEVNFCLVDDLATLVWAANLADLELHTSLARAEAIERPTMIVFDLDPGEGADLLDCCRVALELREMLGGLGLDAAVKSSGSKGLHVHVPLNTEITYAETSPFAHAVARLLEKQRPEAVISRMTRKLRGGKVFVDWSQNSGHKTTASVFSLRAQARPMVAAPVSWTEIEAALSRARTEALLMEAGELLGRLDERAAIFEPLLKARQRLPELGE